MKRLGLFIFATLIAWGIFLRHDSGHGDPVDLVIALGLGVLWLGSVLSMIWEEEDWSIRALGILGMVAGDAVLYLAIGESTWREHRIPEAVLDLARAFFTVGAPLFFLARVSWIRDRRRQHREEPS